MSGRVQFASQEDGLKIKIKVEPIGLGSMPLLLFITGIVTFGTVMWLSSVYHVTKMIVEGAKHMEIVVFFCFFLLGLAFQWALAAYTMLWSFIGEEIITLREGTLEIKNSVFGLGMASCFQASLVQNLQMSTFLKDQTRWSKTGFVVASRGNVSFDHDGATYQFGPGLTEAEVKQVIDQMAMFLPNALQRPAEQKSF
jgi:hypothetical protein